MCYIDIYKIILIILKYLKYQWATAPDITISWQEIMNSDVHIKPMIYTHHIYFIQVGSTYSTSVKAKTLQSSNKY